MIRPIYSAGLAFLISILVGPGMIVYLRKLKFGQTIRADGPQHHLRKSGIPTMGGIIILIAVTLATIWFAGGARYVTWALFITLGYGLIGLVDDFIIVVKKRSLGLRARYKLAGQVVLALLLGLYVLAEPGLGSRVTVPFSGAVIDLGLAYLLFAVLVVVGFGNAVNLTDGLDGLAAGTMFAAALAYSLISVKVHLPGLAAFAGAIAGACLGFSWFNSHPAQVFMGDTGALALGGALGALALLTKTELSLVVIGGVFVVETLSVIIQVIWFKFTGNRVFRMSPIHHHFELAGWLEPKVVVRFWIVAAVFAVLGLAGAGVF